MPEIFFTADTHFGHGNIIKHCNRPFRSIDEHDSMLIQRWNAKVKRGDHVWHLGDFAWKNHLHYRGALNGNIHLILGNHDKASKKVLDQFSSVHELYQGRVTGDRTSHTFFLFHYPVVSWPKKAYGAIHLYGHVHGRHSRPGERALDVGVDCYGYAPVSYDEVERYIVHNLTLERPPKQVIVPD